MGWWTILCVGHTHIMHTHILPITISISLVGANVGVGIFNVVTFPNDPCTTSQGLNGTCLTSDECTTVGGSGDGTCASGVCCSVTQTCGETTSTNNTYLSQSATKVANVCTYTICPTSTDICQFRIDFEKFVMADASSTTFTKGTCVDDNLVISSPTGPNPPLVCGTLTGHHMYITASSTCNTIQATIGSTDTTTSREWSMRGSHIECTNPLLPPSGCLQYFTGLTGYFSSFGWDGSQDGATAATAPHQNNQQYSICFRREEGYCSMEYFTPTTGFSVGGTSAIASQALYGEAACFDDFLSIPGILESPTTLSTSTAFTTTVGDRICGLGWTKFPSPSADSVTLVTYTKPFMVGVNFDGNDELASTDSQVGFSILYTQKACA